MPFVPTHRQWLLAEVLLKDLICVCRRFVLVPLRFLPKDLMVLSKLLTLLNNESTSKLVAFSSTSTLGPTIFYAQRLQLMIMIECLWKSSNVTYKSHEIWVPFAFMHMLWHMCPMHMLRAYAYSQVWKDLSNEEVTILVLASLFVYTNNRIDGGTWYTLNAFLVKELEL